MRKITTDNSGLLFWLIVLLALVLRIVALDHTFPFILHPDEPAVVRAALGIRFDINPGHFDWPHLFIYLNYFVYMGFAKIRDLLVAQGFKESISAVFPLIWNDNLIFYLISRFLAAVLGALTVIPVYMTGKLLFGNRVGFFAALALAVAPFHVYHSHFALIDVPMTFFLAWALYFSAEILIGGRTDSYVLAGLFTGLAASTKYNGALVALTVPLAHFFQKLNSGIERLFKDSAVSSLFLSGFFAIIGFIAGTPFSVLDSETFIRTDGPKGALWQFTNVGGVGLGKHIGQFFSSFVYKLSDDFGYTFLIAYVLVFLYFLFLLFRRKGRADEYKIWFLLLPSMFFFWYVSGTKLNRSHYYMITYPFVALIAGYFIDGVVGWLGRFRGTRVLGVEVFNSLAVRVLKGVGVGLRLLLAILFFAIPLYLSVERVVGLMGEPEITPDTYIYGGESRSILDLPFFENEENFSVY